MRSMRSDSGCRLRKARPSSPSPHMTSVTDWSRHTISSAGNHNEKIWSERHCSTTSARDTRTWDRSSEASPRSMPSSVAPPGAGGAPTSSMDNGPEPNCRLSELNRLWWSSPGITTASGPNRSGRRNGLYCRQRTKPEVRGLRLEALPHTPLPTMVVAFAPMDGHTSSDGLLT